ncbi:type II secretion system GspH family protein [Candidatus Pelagibacter bacterium]|jgi:prepilin-type N-terminal cleavage/methylation domain-containing protein|nr:type II secretion system GspH family protein [Candidatus Pelagibacter bacterium]
MRKNAFTILELLVVLAVIGVFSVVAYPKISNWIEDRNVKKEVYEVINFVKEKKSMVASDKYAMIQLSLKPNLEVYTMDKINFVKTYRNVNNSNTLKRNNQCTYGTMQSGFIRNQSLETLKLSVSNNDSNVHVYPNAAHNPPYTVLCLTKDNSISYNRLRKTERDAETGKTVDIFIFCSKSNSTQNSCQYNANFDHMYKITISKNTNMKVYKKNKNKNWTKIDG